MENISNISYGGEGILNTIITIVCLIITISLLGFIGGFIPIPIVMIAVMIINLIIIIVTIVLLYKNNKEYVNSITDKLKSYAFSGSAIGSTGALIGSNSPIQFKTLQDILTEEETIGKYFDNILLLLYLQPINNNSSVKQDYINLNDSNNIITKNDEQRLLFYYNTIISIICNNYLDKNNQINNPDDKNIYSENDINNAILLYIILYNISDKQLTQGNELIYIKKINEQYYVGKGVVSDNILESPTDFNSMDTWNAFGYYPNNRYTLLPDNAMIKLEEFYHIVQMKLKNNMSGVNQKILDLTKSPNIDNFIIKLKELYDDMNNFQIQFDINNGDKPVYNMIKQLKYME